MIEWKESMTVFHGSFCAVTKPQLEKCSPYKDFGLGFYVTTSEKQAKRFVPAAVRKAIRLGLVPKGTDFGFVSTYEFCPSSLLRLKEYTDADAEWLHCVAAHRKDGVFLPIWESLQAYDLIAGKIANDQTNATLTAYLAELYGELGSKEADEDCIRRLLPERLENQICLRSEAALRALTFQKEEKLWLSKP